MNITRKFLYNIIIFSRHIKAQKKEIKYSIYSIFVFSFLIGATLQYIPNLLAKHNNQQVLNKTEEHSNKKAVSVSKVEMGELKKTFTIFSSLKGKHEVQIYTDNKVTIKKVLVLPGDFVKRGQALVVIESSSLKIRKRLSDIDFQLKEAEFTVTKNLAEKEFVSKNEMNQKSLEFEAEKLRQELNKSESTNIILAPISGLITEVKYNAGDYIDDSSKYYIKIVDQTTYRIEAYLPYEVSNQLTINGIVEISNIQNTKTDEIKMRNPATIKNYYGKIIHISPGIDQATGTVSVEVESSLPANLFQVGSFVETKFILAEAKNAIIIKNESILYEDDRPYVYKIVNSEQGTKNTVEIAYVNIGLNEGSKTVILNGLNASDFIVHEGQNNLKNKDNVEIFDRQ